MSLPVKMGRIGTLVFWLIAIVGLAGCATAVERHSSSEVGVKKGVPVVYIYPLAAETYAHATVGVLPFLLPAGKDPKAGQQIAALYQDVLLGKAAFPVVKVLPAAYGDFAEALTAGRLAGIDLVLVGKINHAVEGTELGGTRLDVTVRLLNVSTGATVWHIGQAMDQPYDYPKTDLISRLSAALGSPPIKRPAGAPVLINMLAQAAVDMTDVIVGSRYVRR